VNLEEGINHILTMGKGVSLKINEKGKIERPSLNGAKVKALLRDGLKGSSFLDNFPEISIDAPEIIQNLSQKTVEKEG